MDYFLTNSCELAEVHFRQKVGIQKYTLKSNFIAFKYGFVVGLILVNKYIVIDKYN